MLREEGSISSNQPLGEGKVWSLWSISNDLACPMISLAPIPELQITDELWSILAESNCPCVRWFVRTFRRADRVQPTASLLLCVNHLAPENIETCMNGLAFVESFSRELAIAMLLVLWRNYILHPLHVYSTFLLLETKGLVHGSPFIRQGTCTLMGNAARVVCDAAIALDQDGADINYVMNDVWRATLTSVKEMHFLLSLFRGNPSQEEVVLVFQQALRDNKP